jgi:hypothetical protein
MLLESCRISVREQGNRIEASGPPYLSHERSLHRGRDPVDDDGAVITAPGGCEARRWDLTNSTAVMSLLLRNPHGCSPLRVPCSLCAINNLLSILEAPLRHDPQRSRRAPLLPGRLEQRLAVCLCHRDPPARSPFRNSTRATANPHSCRHTAPGTLLNCQVVDCWKRTAVFTNN